MADGSANSLEQTVLFPDEGNAKDDASRIDSFRKESSTKLRNEFLSTENPSGLQRTTDGFVERASEFVLNPKEAGMHLALGFSGGILLQTALNNAERMGGNVGTGAKIAKYGFFYGAPLVMGMMVASAEDPYHEAGRLGADLGLFTAAGFTGRAMQYVPGMAKVMEPGAMTAVPDGLKYSVIGNRAVVHSSPAGADLYQVRLANGMGFSVRGGHNPPSPYSRYDSADPPEIMKLSSMPTNVQGIGRFEYSASSTTLRHESGQVYTRDLTSGVTSMEAAGARTWLTDGRTFTAVKGTDGTIRQFHDDGRQFLFSSGSRAEISPNGFSRVVEGSFQSGYRWDFLPDGGILMKSLPAGKFQLRLNSEGAGEYMYTHGTSSGIRGMRGGMGGRTNASPLKREVTEVRVEDGAVKTVDGIFKIPQKPTFESAPDFTRLRSAAENLKTIQAGH